MDVGINGKGEVREDELNTMHYRNNFAGISANSLLVFRGEIMAMAWNIDSWRGDCMARG